MAGPGEIAGRRASFSAVRHRFRRTRQPLPPLGRGARLTPRPHPPETTMSRFRSTPLLVAATLLAGAATSAGAQVPDSVIAARWSGKSLFRVNVDGGTTLGGEYGTGSVPIEGSGTRLMWYPRRAAFRAGYINGTQWDDANIGNFSTAFGENVRALGDNSLALGKNTVAANTGTIALGEGNTATGANSVALGYGASTSTIVGSPRLGTFVFSDRSVPLTYSFNGTSPDIESQFHPSVTNSFNVRAVNGSFFYTNTALTTGFVFNSTTANLTLTNSKFSMASDGSTTFYSNGGQSAGVTLAPGGGSWNNLSDRNMKENFAPVDARHSARRFEFADFDLEL